MDWDAFVPGCLRASKFPEHIEEEFDNWIIKSPEEERENLEDDDNWVDEEDDDIWEDEDLDEIE